jgi:hypothetical protein
MGDLSKWLFRIGYYPFHYEAIKHDFVRWYRKAAQHHSIQTGLEVTNSDLRSLTLEAAEKAENFDEESPAISFLDYIEDVVEKAETWFHYIALGLCLIGGSGVVASWYALHGWVLHIGRAIGIVVFGCGFTAVSLYHVLKHQLRTNAELVALFNRELVERPGEIRRNDRDREKLIAQYLWNRSLSRPRTISVLLLLAMIRVISSRLYGRISNDIQDNVQDFVGMEAREILAHQFNRLPEALFGSYYLNQSG